MPFAKESSSFSGGSADLRRAASEGCFLARPPLLTMSQRRGLARNAPLSRPALRAGV
jgi:hypothetical protein